MVPVESHGWRLFGLFGRVDRKHPRDARPRPPKRLGRGVSSSSCDRSPEGSSSSRCLVHTRSPRWLAAAASVRRPRCSTSKLALSGLSLGGCRPPALFGWGGLPGVPTPLAPSVAEGNADGARRPHFRRVEVALACARTTRCVEAPAPTPTRPSDDEHGSLRQDRIPRRRFRATNSPSPGRLPPAMTLSFDWAWSRSFAWEVTRGPSHPCRAAVARAIVVTHAPRR